MTSLPNESVIQARLKQLSNQEFEIVSTLKQHNYSLDPRLETEMTKKYGAIHEDYTNINNTEALKRAIFIQWYAAVEPAHLTGIGVLHRANELETMRRFAVLQASQGIDTEFARMMQHYDAVAGWYFNAFKTGIDPHLISTMLTEDQETFEYRSRGQMGLYWSSLSSENKGDQHL